MYRLWRRGLILALLLAFATPALCLEWYSAYQKGQDEIKKGNCEAGKNLMLEALKKQPNDDLHARPYGTFLMEYIPHFYLFKCAVTAGDSDSAAKYMKDAEAGGVSQSTVAAEFRQLKLKLPQNSKPPTQVVVDQKPPPVTTTTPTTTTTQTTQPDKQAQIVQALKESREALAAGDYDRARIAAFRVNSLSPNQPEARRILQEIDTREKAEQQTREKREKLDQATRALQSGDLDKASSLVTELQSQYSADTQVEALAQQIQKQRESQKQPPQPATGSEQVTLERLVVVSFYKGQYNATIELAQQGIAKYSDSWRLQFFLGCSYASLALMEKENNTHLGLARAAFAKARAIDSKVTLPPLISPKILKIYNNS